MNANEKARGLSTARFINGLSENLGHGGQFEAGGVFFFHQLVSFGGEFTGELLGLRIEVEPGAGDDLVDGEVQLVVP